MSSIELYHKLRNILRLQNEINFDFSKELNKLKDEIDKLKSLLDESYKNDKRRIYKK